jgi:hypothetical protein
LLDNFAWQAYPSADDVLREKEKTMMRKRKIKLLDTVALVQDIPSRKLKRGEVGTVVEILAPEVYEVEFCDAEGQTYADLAIRGSQLIPLHNQGDALRIVA